MNPLLSQIIADQKKRAYEDRLRLVESYIAERPELEGNSDAVVELLMNEYRLRQELGEQPTVDEYKRRFPNLGDRLQRHFSLQQLLNDGATAAMPTADPNETTPFHDGAASASNDPTAPTIAGYEILSELGRGGMGIVYKARQLSLQRIVALKVVSDRTQPSKTQLMRFRREAESLARLKHPNIVQVYEISENEGTPYFAMEYVDGGDLDEFICDAHMAAERVAELFESLARAIHAAHAQSLVHRDLKPSNILLTTDGEPKITDFGLVKQMEQESIQTQTGSIFGTPNYMAPEQTTGDPRDVGPLADVHALGGIAYAMLTGLAPFSAPTTMETLDKVRMADPTPPRSLRADVPRDLETICLKCLQKDPAKRYGSALELADDLHRYRTNQPIQARPVGYVERLAKWMRRRPALATAVGVSVVAVVALLTMGAWTYFRVRAEAQRAEKKFQLARSVVDDMYTKVAVELLAEEGRQDPLRQELLEKTLKFYLQFAKEKSDDESIRKEVAQSYFRVGEIYRILGQIEKATKAYGEAVSLQERLCREFPHDTDLQFQLAESLNWRGELNRQRGDATNAERDYEGARKIQAALMDRFPGYKPYAKALARSDYNLAIILTNRNEANEAEKRLTESIRLLAALHKKHTGDSSLRHELAKSHINRGVLYKQQGKLQLAENDYKASIALLGIEYSDRPTSSWRRDLATSHHNLGNLFLEQKRFGDAYNHVHEALVILKQLVADFPTRPEFKKKLGSVHNSLGSVLWRQAKIKEAGGEWNHAESLLSDLVDRFPKTSEYEQQLGIVEGNLALVAYVEKNPKRARAYLRKSTGRLQAVLKHEPKNREIRRFLRDQYQTLAEILVQSGEHAEAVVAAQSLADVLPDRPLESYYAACFVARCIPLVKDESLKAVYVKTAVSHLKNAVERLPGELRRLPNESEIFQVLADDAEYQRVIAELNKRIRM